MSSIVFRDSRRMFSPVRCLLILLVLLGVFAYFIRPVALNRESVVLKIRVPSVLAYPSVATTEPDKLSVERSARRVEGMSMKSDEQNPTLPTQADAHSTTHGLLPLPPHGADAIGSPGAWDGRDQEGDLPPSASMCVDTVGHSTAQLKLLIPPSGQKDHCDYAIMYGYRADRPPAEIIASSGWMDSRELSRYLKTGLWAAADFAQINSSRLSPTATLNVYLILKRAGSPHVAHYLGIMDQSEGLIEEFLKTGACPKKFSSNLSGPYCMVD